MTRVLGVIPARLQSTRLPRKLLLAETGKPLLQHTWEAASRAKSLDDLIIAVDHPELLELAESFGATVVMTGEHASGTDRIAEVVQNCSEQYGLVVNIQGDEPELDAAQIDQLVTLLAENESAEMATLASPLDSHQARQDPGCVKVVTAINGRALYFSRSPIPFLRNGGQDRDWEGDFMACPWWLHIGIYAYRKEFLLQFAATPPSPLELLEKLEQLRALEMGCDILVGKVRHHAVGIDTPEDYADFVNRFRGVKTV
ncbi:3-deoxy-manno-octulosonate cytidylyltransferase [Calycomorphotria hydatis]|uniref:3-deoxy-manno-octulosonate cytidylyltransferase n=1 Tax=Calycomorphotria hydatis TaxID=2528027 RepID=A0A517T694_9PLAN|nr:3-deoxy-manno-octulosonate cytidylyltransferase [Calycomorphotria hydatis]QDT63897.1 3-deoxy-manno-octulosonate cytidylyltransferase [Calycomorphotria hydatis]